MKGTRKAGKTPFAFVCLFAWLGLLCAAAGMLILGFWESGTASAVMSLNYSESLCGKTPNGERFRTEIFRSEEWLAAILDTAGLKDTLTVEELSEMLSVVPVEERPDDAKSNFYCVTSYRVTVCVPLSLRQSIDAQNLLDAVCQEYQRQFVARYHLPVFSPDEDTTLSELDFDGLAAFYTRSYHRMARYLEMRSQQDESRSSSTGVSYAELLQRLEELERYPLAEFVRYYRQHGVSKSAETAEERILCQKEEITTLQWETESFLRKYEANRQLAEDHADPAADAARIPGRDADGSTVLSRPETATDALLLSARECSEEAGSRREEIAEKRSEVDALQKGCTEEERQTAQAMADELAQKTEDFVAVLRRLEEECNARHLETDLLFVRETRPFWQNRFVAGGLLFGAAVLCWIFSVWGEEML